MNIPPHPDPSHPMHKPPRAQPHVYPVHTQFPPNFRPWSPRQMPRSAYPPPPPPQNFPHFPPPPLQQFPPFAATGTSSVPQNPPRNPPQNPPYFPHDPHGADHEYMVNSTLSYLQQMMGYEFTRVHSHLDHIHRHLNRLRDEIDNLKYIHEQGQRGRPSTRAQAWTDGPAMAEEQGPQVEEVFGSECNGNSHDQCQARAQTWGYGSDHSGNGQYDDEARQHWNDVQDSLHYGGGSNAGASRMKDDWRTNNSNNRGSNGNNGGWNSSHRFGNVGAGGDWDGEHNSVAAGSVKSVNEGDGWRFTEVAVEHEAEQDEKWGDAQSTKSVVEKDAGDGLGDDKQDDVGDGDSSGGSIKGVENEIGGLREGSANPTAAHTASVVKENVVSRAATEKAESVREGTAKTEVVDMGTLKGDLTYAVGECAGMLKIFGRIVAQPEGVEGTPFDRAGRDLYRALRELEGTMEAIRRAKRYGN